MVISQAQYVGRDISMSRRGLYRGPRKGGGVPHLVKKLNSSQYSKADIKDQ